MAKINISDLEASMVLKSPVFNSSGNLLLKEGSAISEKHISIFKKWGVLEVDIIGIDKDDVNLLLNKKISDEELQDIDLKIQKRFICVGNNSVMKEIVRITKKILIQTLIDEKMQET